MEFRQEAVRLLRTSGGSIPRLASELEVSPQSLRNWRKQLAVDAGAEPGLSTDEREELRRLWRDVRVLSEEREILKKSTATSSGMPTSLAFRAGPRVLVNRLQVRGSEI